MSGLVPLGVDIMRYDYTFLFPLYTFMAHGKMSVSAARIHAYQYDDRSELALQATSFGAVLHTKVSRKVTHLVASTSRTRTTKVKQAASRKNIKIVNQQWLLNSMSKWQKEDEEPYLVSFRFG